MRPVSERSLQDPFPRWIDRNTPLPENIALAKRTVNLPFDLGMFVILGIMFGGMGAAFIALPLSFFDPRTDGLLNYAPPLAIGVALLIFPAVLMRRAVLTLSAWRDERRGCLRQGVFSGPEGMLVRLEPRRCYVIPWDRFVGVKLFPPAESRDTRNPTMIVETRDGNLEFFSERLEATPESLQRDAKQACPSWSAKAGVRKDRKKRKEKHSRKKFVRSASLFAGGMVAIGASLAATIASPTSNAAGVGLLAGFVLLGAGIVSIVRMVVATLFRYRCHECGQRIERYYEALPAVNYYCASCNIEWETGLEEHESDGH